MNNATGLILILVIVFFGGYYYFSNPSEEIEDNTEVVSEETQKEAGGNAVKETPTTSSNSIVGEWRSIEDSSFTRSIRADGVYADVYADDPDASSAGVWRTFTKASAPGELPYPLKDGATYMELSGSVKLYYEIVSVSQKGLVLIYLNRGNILEFVRAQ